MTLLPLLLLTLGLQTGRGPAGAAEYVWPMATGPALTSSFGEYRPGRLHAGLDLKTWGREGIPVLAVADGFVSRVRTSPWGYGKAVYLRLADGRTAVYGHLSAFAPAVHEVVRREQRRRGTYSVNLFLEEDRISVKRGDVIGASGSTGTGFPHLHFELRDEVQRPVNPLVNGLPAKDTLPPVIRSLSLLPLEAGSLVDGRRSSVVLPMSWRKKKDSYGSLLVPVIEGPIGLSVSLYDRADASALTNRLAPYRLRLLVDGRRVFEMAYTAFGYDQVYQADLDYDFGLRSTGIGEYHNLFLRRGNRLPLYGSYKTGDGVLHAAVQDAERGVSLRTGYHQVVVQAEDAAGNRSEAALRLRVATRLQVANAVATFDGDAVRLAADLTGRGVQDLVFEGSADGGASWQELTRIPDAIAGKVERAVAGSFGVYRIRAGDGLAAGTYQTCAPAADTHGPGLPSVLSVSLEYRVDFAILRIVADREMALPPRAVARWRGLPALQLKVRQEGRRVYSCLLPFRPDARGAAKISLVAVGTDGTPGFRAVTVPQQRVSLDGGRVTSADGMAEARFEAGEVYEPIYGCAQPVSVTTRSDLPPVGLAYRFSPGSISFRGRVNVALRYAGRVKAPDRLGVYEYGIDSTWAFVGKVLDKEGGAVSAEVKHFSTFALLLDETPPFIGDLQPAEGDRAARQPRMAATVLDSGSGIAREEDIQMLLDGRRLIVEYDPEEDLIVALQDGPLEPGAHRMEVVVRDACGNASRAVSSFYSAPE